jgi:hypothetical protein
LYPIQYLSQLDSSRASSDDKLLDVGVALCAVDRILGEEQTDRTNTNKKEVDAAAKRTLKNAWTKWAMEFHSFSMLTLSDQDLASISDAVKEFLFSEHELAVTSGASADEISRADKKKNVLPSLKYFFPTVPKPGEKPKPLTNDQKAQNVIYVRELKKFWKKCREELDNRVLESVARALRSGNTREGEEKEQKSKMYGEQQPRSSSGTSGNTNTKAEQQAKSLEMQCLNDLSLKKLRQWVEEDEDDRLSKELENSAEKLRESKKSHEQFVKKKDRCCPAIVYSLGVTLLCLCDLALFREQFAYSYA